MIKKSIFAALVMLIAYQLMCPYLPGRYRIVPGYQRNSLKKAQDYSRKASQITTLLVGSSMIGRLPESVLGPDSCKLDFAGGNSLTALELAKRHNTFPKFLVIEINLLLNDDNDDVLQDASNPVNARLRRHLSMFTEDQRPSNFAAGITRSALNRIRRIIHPPESREQTASDLLSPELKALRLEDISSHWSRQPKQELLQQRVDRLAEYIGHFSQKGTICVLTEMPIDESLSRLALPTAIRNAVAQKLPPSHFHWFKPEKGTFETVDLNHLKHSHAKEFAQQLVQYLHELEDSTQTTQPALPRNNQVL